MDDVLSVAVEQVIKFLEWAPKPVIIASPEPATEEAFVAALKARGRLVYSYGEGRMEEGNVMWYGVE